RKADLPSDFRTVPITTSQPIHFFAKLSVRPCDWPLLDQVHGVDVVAQTERQRETFLGYPWSGDETIHPNQWKRSLIHQVQAYLGRHYADSLDLKQLGRQIGVSPYSLLRMFRSQVGLSPREYQIQLRITRAKRLLRDGLPTAQVAVETG